MTLCIAALACFAGKSDWCSLDEVDTSLKQKALSHAIDQTIFDSLLSSALDSRSKTLALSTAIPHAGYLLVLLYDCKAVCNHENDLIALKKTQKTHLPKNYVMFIYFVTTFGGEARSDLVFFW